MTAPLLANILPTMDWALGPGGHVPHAGGPWRFVAEHPGLPLVLLTLLALGVAVARLWRSRARLRRVEARLRQYAVAVEHSPASIMVTLPDGRIEYVNPKTTQVTGYAAEELVGETPAILNSGYQSREFYEAMWRRIASGREWRGEFRNRRKDGSLYWEDASIAPVLDARGRVTRYVAVKEDITERKRLLERLERTSATLREALEHMRHALVRVDAEGRMVAWNQKLMEFFDFDPGVMHEGTPFETLQRAWAASQGLDEAELAAHLARTWAGVEFTQEVEAPGGRTILLTHAPVPAGGFVRTYVDITADKQAERLKEDMDRILRHDLKAPLNAILGAPQVLELMGGLSEEQREQLGHIEQAGRRMLEMINQSLDLYKMETGRYELARAPVDLAALAARVVQDLSRRAGGRSVAVEVSGSATAAGEELLLYTLVANLLDNAVEAAPHGAVVDVALAMDGDTDGSMAEVRISNPGEVPDGVRERFFEKYATAGKTGGTGLGTYSARLIARTHGGDVELDASAPGRTTVTVRLPGA